jgi:Na+-translocating ferredoxin:NAD+ oxidoreductase RnfG subunit
MKLKPALLAATLVVFSASTAAVFAVEEQHTDGKIEKAEAAKTENVAAKKPLKKKMKKHSHMEEKTGMPMPEPTPAEGKVLPKNRHDHTQDKH